MAHQSAPATLPPMDQGIAVSERPVFVTPDGRHRRAPRWVARAVATALVAWVAAVLAGGTGFGALPPLSAHLVSSHGAAASALHTPVKFNSSRLGARRSHV